MEKTGDGPHNLRVGELFTKSREDLERRSWRGQALQSASNHCGPLWDDAGLTGLTGTRRTRATPEKGDAGLNLGLAGGFGSGILGETDKRC